MQKISKDMIIAEAETLEEAALVHGLDPDVLVARLNNFLGAE